MEIYTIAEASKRTHIGTVTLRYLCEQGTMRATKVGGRWLISEHAIEEFFQKHPGDLRIRIPQSAKQKEATKRNLLPFRKQNRK